MFASLIRPLVLLSALPLVACAGAAPVSKVSTGGMVAASARTASDADNDGLEGRLVIKTAELSIISSDPRGGFRKAQRLAKRMGGYTLNASRAEDRVSITLRIPAARFEEAVRRLGKLGKLERREVQGKDVTAEVVDLRLRLKNALKMRERYLQLLARAQNVEEAVKVQKELERVTESIETMKGKLGLLENQVNLATIRLTLETPTRPGPLGWVFYGAYRGVKWLFVWD